MLLKKPIPRNGIGMALIRRLFDLFGFGHGIPAETTPPSETRRLEKLIIDR
jgi:hypothetical protein